MGSVVKLAVALGFTVIHIAPTGAALVVGKTGFLLRQTVGLVIHGVNVLDILTHWSAGYLGRICMNVL